MKTMSTIIHTSSVSVINLEGLALDASRPGRLVPLEEIKGGDAVAPVVDEPSVSQKMSTENYPVG